LKIKFLYGNKVSVFISLLFVNIFCCSENEIKIGMSTALTGAAKELGSEMKQGVDAYFNKINKDGGVNGINLRLIALDDGYEPSNTSQNMRKLIDEEKVLAVIGNVGTPTAIVAVPIANETKTLLFGAFTGAGVLRKNPPDRYVINFRASYAEETSSMIDGLINKVGIKPQEIAFFTQNDGYGDSGYSGAIEALKKLGVVESDRLSHGRYTRNTLNVEEGLSIIMESEVEPKAIIMVGAYAPCSKFIKLAKPEFPNAMFLNVSFVGSNALLNELKNDSEGVVITQTVPYYANNSLPVINEYLKTIKEFDSNSKPGFVSLEGFIAAKIFVEGLKNCSDGISKESIIDSLESFKKLDIGIGFPIGYSKDMHQASHNVWITQISKGGFKKINWEDLKK